MSACLIHVGGSGLTAGEAKGFRLLCEMGEFFLLQPRDFKEKKPGFAPFLNVKCIMTHPHSSFFLQALFLSHSCSDCPHVRTLILEPLEWRDYERETPEQWKLCCELNTSESSTALPSWGRRSSKLPPLMAGSAPQGHCGLAAGHASRAAPGTAGSRQRR